MATFKNFLKQQNLKPSTIHKHLKVEKRLAPYLKNIDAYFKKLQKQGKANTYLSQMVSTVRRIGQFQNNEKLKNFPFFGNKTKNIRATMSNKEIEKFLALKPYGKQERKRFFMYQLFFKIMAFCGMRCGETASLQKRDVDFSRKLFVLGDTKTNKFRLVPIPDILLVELKKHHKMTKRKYLFTPKHKDGPLRKDNWSYAFRTRIRRLGIKRKNLCAYSFRHSFITSKIAQDVNLFRLQRLIGHSNSNTTKIYTHLTVDDLRSVVNPSKKDDLLPKIYQLLTKLDKKLDQVVKIQGRR